MSSQKSFKQLKIQWKTLSLPALILFMFSSMVVEYFIVLCAIILGLEDKNMLLWSFQYPGTDFTATVAISLLFHVVPLTAIITLTFSWICLTKYLALSAPKTLEEKIRQVEKGKRKLTSKINQGVTNSFAKIKSALIKFKGIAYISRRVNNNKTAVKGALITISGFSLFLLLFSSVFYPRLLLNFYMKSPTVLEFVTALGTAAAGLAKTLVPVGWVCATVNNFIIAAAPSIRSLTASFRNLSLLLADQSAVGKYLFIQNFAVWFFAFAVLLYGYRAQKSYRHRRLKKS